MPIVNIQKGTSCEILSGDRQRTDRDRLTEDRPQRWGGEVTWTAVLGIVVVVMMAFIIEQLLWDEGCAWH